MQSLSKTIRRDLNRSDDILEAAAQCFMEQGFAATSIDDVARALQCTKGRIYHHYSSKADLFFDVHREGMDRLFRAVEPILSQECSGGERVEAMLKAHAMTMMESLAFETVVAQGVHMHKLTATTPSQRKTLNGLIRLRRRFEGLFKDAVAAGIADGSIRQLDVSLTVKAMLGAINWMSIWYRPRLNETEGDRLNIANAMVEAQVGSLRVR